MIHGSNEQILRLMIDTTQTATDIANAVRLSRFSTPYEGAVLNGRMCRLSDLQDRGQELWANVFAYQDEILRRLDMTPEERDAETAGMTVEELREAKAIVTQEWKG
jgi:hypothetical protein